MSRPCPYAVRKVEGKGRAAFATEDIRPGQVILESEKFVAFFQDDDGEVGVNNMLKPLVHWVLRNIFSMNRRQRQLPMKHWM